MTSRYRAARLVAVTAAFAVLAGCTGRSGPSGAPVAGSSGVAQRALPRAQALPGVSREELLPGMPANLDPRNVYVADRAGALSPAVRGDRRLVDVPEARGNDGTRIR